MNSKAAAMALAVSLALGVGVVALKQDAKVPWSERVHQPGACAYRPKGVGGCSFADGGTLPERYPVPGWAVTGEGCVAIKCILAGDESRELK